MGITHSVITKTITSKTDNRCEVVAEKPLARTLAVGTGWNSILLGVRGAIDGLPSNVAAAGYLSYVGLLAGKTNLPTVTGDTVGHFVGIRTDPLSNYKEQTGGYGFHKFAPYKIVGGTGTAGTSQYCDVKRTSLGRGAWFLKITKGSPNFTVSLWFSITNDDLSRDRFREIVDSGAPSGADIVASISGATIAIDEATNGYFDTFCYAFSHATTPFEVIDIYPRVLS